MVDFSAVELRVKRASGVDMPEYATEGSVGFDLAANEDMVIPPVNSKEKNWRIISTGLSVELPPFHELQIRSRSGLASQGIVVLNQPGTIDSDYRGEIRVILANLTYNPWYVWKTNRIAQAVIAPVLKAIMRDVDELAPTGRGEKGLGSTGK